jgi:hypothetical protein
MAILLGGRDRHGAGLDAVYKSICSRLFSLSSWLCAGKAAAAAQKIHQNRHINPQTQLM